MPQNYEWTAYHRHISYLDTSAQYHDASLSYINGTGICGWDATPLTQWGSTFATWNTYFYYGGPGQ